MATVPTHPIDPTLPASQTMLAGLQGNILKGHGRERTVHILLQFLPAPATPVATVKAVIKNFALTSITSAKKQFQENEDFNHFGIPGTIFGNFLLTKSGYAALGIAAAPAEPAFDAGMKAAQGRLLDPESKFWDDGYKDVIHAMVILADDDETLLHHRARDVMDQFRPVAKILAVEKGEAMVNKNNDHIEHNNYIDGRSQPMFLTTDIQKEAARGGTNLWDPTSSPAIVLVADPGNPTGFGSFFVFRKLEQNVRGFKTQEKNLADSLGLISNDAERAGALVVGRFEDGTPVTLQEGDGMHKPVPNNFNYASDAGGRCPFIGHVRKVNPRDGSERTRLLARRGITYGHRAVHPSDNPTFEQMPTGDVGLLFMCFQANITNQFEFVMLAWANNKNFPVPNSGIDPVIGQGPSVPPQHWPKEWGDAAKTGSFDFSHFVTMKGGEYFFAPSLGFLTTLA